MRGDTKKSVGGRKGSRRRMIYESGRRGLVGGDAAVRKKKCTKRSVDGGMVRGEGGKKDEGEESSLRSGMRAKGSAKTETARCATASSVGGTQGLPATSAEAFSTPTPSLFFFVDFFQLFETAYEPGPLSSRPLAARNARTRERAGSFQGSRKRISRRFHGEIFGFVHTNDTIASRCNYGNVISSGKFCPLRSSDLSVLLFSPAVIDKRDSFTLLQVHFHSTQGRGCILFQVTLRCLSSLVRS